MTLTRFQARFIQRLVYWQLSMRELAEAFSGRYPEHCKLNGFELMPWNQIYGADLIRAAEVMLGAFYNEYWDKLPGDFIEMRKLRGKRP